jgi:hypothetical protein
MFAGFLTSAGLRDALAVPLGTGGEPWAGEPPVRAAVRLVITDARGAEQTTVVRLTLAPGWG